jgi:hypothetical protein
MPSAPSRVSASRRRPRISIFWLAGAGLAAVGWLLREPALLRYRVWKQQRALGQATAFFDVHDEANGGLALDVAFAAAPGGFDAAGAASAMRGHPEAQQALLEAYRARDDARGMLEVSKVLLELNPSSPRYRHDWALLGLLAGPADARTEAGEILYRLYREDAANPIFATSYAFSLAREGKASEALAVLARLSPADRDFPPRSPYLAYIYGANGLGADVGRMEWIGRDGAYLREERALFLQARSALERAHGSPAKAP